MSCRFERHGSDVVLDHCSCGQGWAVGVIGDRIADLRSPHGSLISVYVDRPSPGGFGALLTDLVKPIRERSGSLDKPVIKSVRDDAGRIRRLAETLEAESAPAYAIFASAMDEIFVLEPLSHSVPNVSSLGPRPYLRPLRAAPRALRSAVVVADRGLVRTFVGFAGMLEELESPMESELGKTNYGGFSGYEEQGARARADEMAQRIWRDAGRRLLREHERRAFDYVAVGSHEGMFEEITRSLHTYLERLPRVAFVANPHDVSVAILRTVIADQDAEVRRQRQDSLAGRVCDTAWSGGNAVLGLRRCLEATNAQAVDTLVVAGAFRRSGVVCSECGFLDRVGSVCPICGSPLFAVDDVVAAAMDAVVVTGGSVHQIDVASPLDLEGVGALTRFSLPD